MTQIVPVDIAYGQYGQVAWHGREYLAGKIHRRQSAVEPLDRFSFSRCSQRGSNRGKGLIHGRYGPLDEFQNGGRATHHDEAIPEPPLVLELLRLVHRWFFPELAYAPEIGEMKPRHGATRLDPAIAELDAVGGNAQARHQIGLPTASLECPANVRHESLVIGGEMIRRKEGHQVLGRRFGYPEQRIEHGRGGASIFWLDHDAWFPHVREQGAIETLMSLRHNHQRSIRR